MASHIDPRSAAGIARALVVVAALAGNVRADVSADTSSTAADPKRIATLIEQLGSGDSWVRGSASEELRSIGPAAIDALLAAAEGSDDLEVAMAARWLADGIPLSAPDDAPEVVAWLARYGTGRPADALAAMQGLLRLDDDAGIEPLARIVRLDRSAAASRMAAALLVRELRPDDPHARTLAMKILRGLGTSRRPTAEFLRAIARGTTGDAEAPRAASASIERLRSAEKDAAKAGPTGPETLAMAMLEDDTIGLPVELGTIFDRSFAALLVSRGAIGEASAEADRMIRPHLAAADDQLRSYRLASALAWCATHGLAAAATGAVETDRDAIESHPLSAYAAALASRQSGDDARAAELADAAFHAMETNRRLHLDAASRIARWGCTDWAVREYSSLTGDAGTPDAEFALASILFSEFLHDLGRDAEAAECLRRLLDDPGRNRPASDELLRQVGRDPQSTRSRMIYFELCAAEARGDRDARLALIGQSLESPAKDVDALIAAFHLPDPPPGHVDRTRRAIRSTLEQLDGEIQADTDDPNPLNEHAWLVANTEGDFDTAVRHSRKSLEMSFDSASYLDTLAHCHAAAGRLDRAVRTQSLAARYEPHNRTIRKNLDRFRRLAAEAGVEVEPAP